MFEEMVELHGESTQSRAGRGQAQNQNGPFAAVGFDCDASGEPEIGKYKLRRQLGKGSTGTVYLARDTFCDEDVALKVFGGGLLARAGTREKATAQFLKEASLAGKLSHPHIASILEASANRDCGYIAMEYVAGGDLGQFRKPDNLLPPQKVIQIGFKSCGALDYAFKHGIVHRDLKPANLMLASDTHVKVADFGSAALRGVSDLAGQQTGSPAYMSPEQIRGEELDWHSDMFSLGTVLYELLAGYRPFAGENVPEVLQKILRSDPDAPSAMRPDLGSRYDDLILRMLAKAPADRYGSWAELALDIARIGRLALSDREIPDSEKFVSLRNVILLATLNDAEIWELVHAGGWSRMPSRTILVKEDQRGTSFFFLASGEVKVTKQGRLLSVLRGGECFGEMAYVKAGGLPRQASVESTTDVAIAEFEPGSIASTSVNCRLALTSALLHAAVDRLALSNDRIIRSGA